jgi:hypothetical protein
VLCKVGVEFAVIVLDTIGAVGTVGSHSDIAFLRRGNEEGCYQAAFWENCENKER